MSIGGAALAVSAALLFLLPYWRETQAPLKEVPLTSYPGSQGYPALSPDGSQFAFVWDGGQENAPPQVYVSLAGRGRPLRLTNTPTAARYTAWSPDGQTIAFLRPTAGSIRGDLILIPALGGPERRIEKGVGRPTWSPDGKWFYFSGVVSPTSYALFVQPSGGGDKRRLTDPPAEAYGDRTPAVSPDGRHLVFIRAFADYDEDLFVADLLDGNRTGTPRRLTNDHRYKYSPVWTTEGKDIIYVAGQATSFMAMYRVRVSGGPPVRMAGIGDYAQQLAIAPRGNRLVYSRSFRDYNIWRMPLGGNSAGAPSKFIFSTRYEVSPAYSPDGKHIAFSSNRSGARQIWVADAKGSNPVALTSFAEGVAGSPKWSPDGQTVVFDARPDGPANVYRPSGRGDSQEADRPPRGQPCPVLFRRWPLDLLRIHALGPAANLSHAIKRRGGRADNPQGRGYAILVARWQMDLLQQALRGHLEGAGRWRWRGDTGPGRTKHIRQSLCVPCYRLWYLFRRCSQPNIQDSAAEAIRLRR